MEKRPDNPGKTDGDSWYSRLSFERFYLFYLALLPAVGSLHVLQSLSFPPALVLPLLILGMAAVAVYLAAVTSYLNIPETLWERMLMVLNGPLFALIGILVWPGPVFHLLTMDMLMEVAGTCLALFMVTMVRAPLAVDRRVGMIVLGFPLGLVLMISVLYLHQVQDSFLLATFFLLMSVGQIGFTRSRLVDTGEVLREDLGVLLSGILAWVLAFIAGNAFFQG